MTTVEFPQSCCQFGVQRVDITPPVGIYHRMWGAAAHDRSTGVHRPLTATAMTMGPRDASAPQWVVIGVDHCLLWYDEMETLLQRIGDATSLAKDQVVIFFSHTHAAGLMGLERTELPGGDLIPPYLEELASRLSDAIADASQKMAPATIGYAVGRCSLATNRDYWDAARGAPVCGFNPDGVADDTVIVGRVCDEQGETTATLVNYACHPTTLAWDNTQISPDYVGAMREVIEQQTQAPCCFLQGASGDVGPRDGYVGDLEVADRNGRQLGYAVLAALEWLPAPGTQLAYEGAVVSGATIGTWRQEPIARDDDEVFAASTSEVSLPYRSDLPSREDLLSERDQWEAIPSDDPKAAQEARSMAERMTRRLTRIAGIPDGDAYPYPIRIWRMGRALWIALDGEHYNLLQRTLRHRFPDWTLIIGTLANGSRVWYLPDADSFGQGLYQEDASILARGCLETLIDAVSDELERVTGQTARPDDCLSQI